MCLFCTLATRDLQIRDLAVVKGEQFERVFAVGEDLKVDAGQGIRGERQVLQLRWHLDPGETRDFVVHQVECLQRTQLREDCQKACAAEGKIHILPADVLENLSGRKSK